MLFNFVLIRFHHHFGRLRPLLAELKYALLNLPAYHGPAH